MEVTVEMATDDFSKRVTEVFAWMRHIQMERNYFEQFTGDEPELLKIYRPALDDSPLIWRWTFHPPPITQPPV